MRTSSSTRLGGRHRQRVAVERADLLVHAVGDDLHHLGRAADAPHGRPPPSALARHTMSGTTPKRSVAPPAAIVSPVFTSSNVRSAPWVCSRVAQLVEVPGRRWDHADVHHHRLDDHPGDLAGVLEQHPPHGVEPAERHDVDQAGDLGRDARARGTVAGRSAGRSRRASGYTDTCTLSWCPWYVPSTLIRFGRALAVRISGSRPAWTRCRSS